MTRLAPLPVGFFGISIGFLALANAWRVAARIWAFPTHAATLLTLAALGLWFVMMVAYAFKWMVYRSYARSEVEDPVQSSFLALVPVSTLLATQAVLAYSRTLATVMFAIGAGGGVIIGAYLQGRLWQGGRSQASVTPAIYLPTVATGFVAATAAAALGWSDLGMWLFGTGVLSWLAIESIVLQRVVVSEAMTPALRPTIAIQLAPPVVGGVAYLALTSGVPDIFAQILFGYGLMQALLLIRLLPWVRTQPFTPSYWSFSFGVAALPTMAMRMVERGATGTIQWLAIVLFVVANLVIALLTVKTTQLLITGKLLPPRALVMPSNAVANQTS